MSKYIIVTRHPALVTYIKANGLAPENTPVIRHVTVDDVRDKNVIGVLPMHLAALANTITEIPLRIPENLRGKELSYTDMQEVAGDAVTYVVKTDGAYDMSLRTAFNRGLNN